MSGKEDIHEIVENDFFQVLNQKTSKTPIGKTNALRKRKLWRWLLKLASVQKSPDISGMFKRNDYIMLYLTCIEGKAEEFC